MLQLYFLAAVNASGMRQPAGTGEWTACQRALRAGNTTNAALKDEKLQGMMKVALAAPAHYSFRMK
jgi:hypothetical protein